MYVIHNNKFHSGTFQKVHKALKTYFTKFFHLNTLYFVGKVLLQIMNCLNKELYIKRNYRH